jgi:hypothetical protein
MFPIIIDAAVVLNAASSRYGLSRGEIYKRVVNSLTSSNWEALTWLTRFSGRRAPARNAEHLLVTTGTRLVTSHQRSSIPINGQHGFIRFINSSTLLTAAQGTLPVTTGHRPSVTCPPSLMKFGEFVALSSSPSRARSVTAGEVYT